MYSASNKKVRQLNSFKEDVKNECMILCFIFLEGGSAFRAPTCVSSFTIGMNFLLFSQ